MKKIYSLIGAIAVTSSVFAQDQLIGKVVATPFGQTSTSAALNKTTAVGDTINWNNTVAEWLPEFAATGQLTRYGYTGGGYIFGNNVDGLNMCAQGFLNVQGSLVTINKVLLSAYEKTQTSTGTSNIKVNIYDMAVNKAWNETAPSATTSAQNSEGPNTLKSSVLVPFTMVDTTSSPALMGSHFTVATFSTPVAFTGNFAVALDARTAAGLAVGDSLGLLADEDDVNNAQDFTFHFFNNRWYVTDYLFDGLKINIAIFPVIDNNASVGLTEFYNGVKLNAIYPNPTKDVATIAYSLEKASDNVSLEVFTVNGQKAYSEKFGNQQAGDYKITLDATSLSAGSYFYQLRANGNVVTKEFIVTK